MATILAFDGLSGTGKSSVSRAVSEHLASVLPTQWVPHDDRFGINHLRDLLFRYRDAWHIDAVARQSLRHILHRQQWFHLISPVVEAGEVCILDNPCLPLEPSYRGADFEFTVDLHVITLCNVELIPDRIANRKGGSYPIVKENYVPGGAAYRAMDYFRERVKHAPHVLAIDTTETTVAEAAAIVLAECTKRFGWELSDDASLCESQLASG